MLKFDFQRAKLKAMRSQVQTAKQYFANHETRADEVLERQRVDDLDFLLTLIAEYERKQ